MSHSNTWVNGIQRWLNPFVLIFLLTLIDQVYGSGWHDSHIALLMIIFVSSYFSFRELELCTSVFDLVSDKGRAIIKSMSAVTGVTMFVVVASEYTFGYQTSVFVAWTVIGFVVTGFIQIGVARLIVRVLQTATANKPRVAVVGANHVGVRFAHQMRTNPMLWREFIGYFDDRELERLQGVQREELLGRANDIIDYARSGRVDLVYIALPMTAQKRIFSLIAELEDTTASVFFLPDIQIFDLIRARFDTIHGIPIVAMVETPFYGLNALKKRLLDITVSLLVLLVGSPLLLAIAIAVRLDSPGPVIFTQRRYGLNGKVINVYKFRSMTVTEDSGEIRQATSNDPRTTRIGKFLRRTSLDELPQFVNVLKGDMSVVGPRPHAIAHNEQYRKLIAGYMIRHKAKPGLTGWAQVNGFRGELKTLDDMVERVNYDLDYLRCWSLSFDLWIMFRTVQVVIHGNNAY